MNKKVAMIALCSWPKSHADIFAAKIQRGYLHDGGPGPAMDLVSLHVRGDQYATLRGLATTATVADALTLGTGKLAVDGILLMTSQGYFDRDAKGQAQVPAARIWQEIQAVFTTSAASCPVFCSKWLSPNFAESKAIYDGCKTNGVPLMCGSSFVTTWRGLDVDFPAGAHLAGAIAAGYSEFTTADLEHFAFHSLEALQCQVEQRQGGETGVTAVTCVTGQKLATVFADLNITKGQADDVLSRLAAKQGVGDYLSGMASHPQAGLIMIEYSDGVKGVVLHADGAVDNTRIKTIVAGKIVGNPTPVRVLYEVQATWPFAHFSYQLQQIDNFFTTRVTPIPVERTLLCGGILDAALRSRAAGGVRVITPELAISYQAARWQWDGKPLPAPIAEPVFTAP